MYEILSETVSEELKAENVPLVEWKFSVDNGNIGVMNVSDPLLDTIESATERAKSDFLRNAFMLKEVRFTTYLTDFAKNDVISVKGLSYMIKGITTVITSKSIKTQLRCIRYE